MRFMSIHLLLVIAFALMIGSCTDKLETPEIPNGFVAKLSIVVLEEVGEEPVGVADIPVVVREMHQVDPGPFTYDTVFTNSFGVAFLKEVVGCGTYDDHGKLVVKIGDIMDTTIYFANKEDINIIFKLE